MSEHANAEPSKEATSNKNPSWIRDELILALDLYVRRQGRLPSKTDAEVVDLSEALNAIQKALGGSGNTKLRNVSGVLMKLGNFQRLDPSYTATGRSGLTRGNRLEPQVWEEFSSDPTRLSSVATAIIKAINARAAEPIGPVDADFPEVEEAQEGRLLTIIHLRRERSAKLVRDKKGWTLKKHGGLVCEACGFDFKATYGVRGGGFIECHHLRPVHTLLEDSIISPYDLALLCANCHRMVHVRRPWLALCELKALLQREH